MNRESALLCLERMAVIWPTADLPDPTTERWLHALGELSERTAHTTIEGLAKSAKWWPSFSEFDEAAQVARTQQVYRNPAAKELVAGSPYPTEDEREMAVQGIAAARAALTQQGDA